MKTDQYYQQRKCSPMTLVSGNVTFYADICRSSLERASNDSGVVKNGNFQYLRSLYFIRSFIGKANIIIQYYVDNRRLYSDPKIHDFE